jgi:phosphopantothenoylcysteine decarboxylase / phosphopantothenate---cysteine ligase
MISWISMMPIPRLKMSRDPDSVGRLDGLQILVGVTGGIAAYKSAILVRLLKKAGAEVVVTMTESACRFITPLTLSTLSGNPVVTSLWEQVHGDGLPSDVEHIGLVKWADHAILAPATMNCIGKLACGLADDSLTTFFAAFPPSRTLIAPAMNSGMWRNPATVTNIGTLQERGMTMVGPDSGELACGDHDQGRMSEPEAILEALVTMIATGKSEDPAGIEGAYPHDDGHGRSAVTQGASSYDTRGSEAHVPGRGLLAGKRVLVSAGPTREALDPVRFISNRSTGTQGLAMAEAALAQGAMVTMVAGPGVAPASPGIDRVDVESAAEMAETLLTRAASTDLTIMTAAVADWRPREIAVEKMKKGGDSLSLDLEPTADILGVMAEWDSGGFRVGFAMETSDLERRGLEKLERKQLDMIVCNQLGSGSGFGRGDNKVLVLGPGGMKHDFPRMDKFALGDELVALIARTAFGERS